VIFSIGDIILDVERLLLIGTSIVTLYMTKQLITSSLLSLTIVSATTMVALPLRFARADYTLPPSVTNPTGIYSNMELLPRLRLLVAKLQLAQAGVPLEYTEQIFNDTRAKIYPPPAPRDPNLPPPPGIDWAKLQASMLDPASVAKGTTFIQQYQDAFAKEQAQYGVSPQAITAVMRIETNLGSYLGGTPVFNAFLTQAVNTPSASTASWATQNLVAHVKYCYQSQKDCLGIKGSYAGAYGLTQFLPYSVQTWGVDGNGDGVVDLFNPLDAIPSTANFLVAHGWSTTTSSRAKALASYYGSSVGYPTVTLNYGEALKGNTVTVIPL
jgi:membrane-bound lytic murein transglycosylase B